MRGASGLPLDNPWCKRCMARGGQQEQQDSAASAPADEEEPAAAPKASRRAHRPRRKRPKMAAKVRACLAATLAAAIV